MSGVKRMNIIVSYYQFYISFPYSAGPHTLTAGEAQALNLLRADYLRKVAQRAISNSQLDEDSDYILSAEELDAVQSRLDDYSANFEFKPRQLDEDKKSLLQQELESLAAQFIDSNGTLDLQNEARRRLRARSSAISPSDLGF